MFEIITWPEYSWIYLVGSLLYFVFGTILQAKNEKLVEYYAFPVFAIFVLFMILLFW